MCNLLTIIYYRKTLRYRGGVKTWKTFESNYILIGSEKCIAVVKTRLD